MNKKIKSILMALFTMFLTVGVVYAAWTVWNGKDNTTVQEPITVEWLKTMDPEKTFPNQEYEVRIKVNNVNKDGNGDQKVGVVATRSDDLVRKNICWDVIGDGNDPWCGWKFTEKMAFTLAKNKNAEVWVIVEVPSDAEPKAEWVNFEVTRE